MTEAHKLNITTSATMMFGHVETIEERFEHLVKLREVQAKKPEGSQRLFSIYSMDIPGCGYTSCKNKRRS